MELRKKLETLKSLGWTWDDVIEFINELDELSDKVCEAMQKERPSDEEVPERKALPKADEQSVKAVLRKIGIPAHVKGYQYTTDAILFCVEDRAAINSVTNGLYPEIAKKHATTPSRVERAIRHAIDIAWSRGDSKYKEEIFGYTISSEKGRPTNSEFIAMMSEQFRD